MPEILGDGAVYFDPYSVSSIYNGIELVLETTIKKKILNTALELSRWVVIGVRVRSPHWALFYHVGILRC